MLSMKLLQRVETHWEAIAAAVVAQMRSDPHTPHHQEMDEDETHARAQELVHQLGHWLTSEDDTALSEKYEDLGRTRFGQHVPLAEVVYKIHLIELKTVEYIQNFTVSQTAVEMYGELEMLRALHRFFAIIVYSVVRGYERAANREANVVCA